MTARPHPEAGDRARESPAGDRGITLIEVVTAMAVMSVFMAIFTGGILQIYRFVNHSDAAAQARAEINVAFVRLDREIRYAAGISTPGTVGDDPYVEYLITNAGEATCVELRLHQVSRQLQRRAWPQGDVPASTAWRPLASGVADPQPFTVATVDATYQYQRLVVRLSASAGRGSSAVTTQTEISFTALNTSADTSITTVCTEGRTIP